MREKKGRISISVKGQAVDVMQAATPAGNSGKARQVKQIMTALKKAVQDTEDNFTKHKRSNSEFRFRK